MITSDVLKLLNRRVPNYHLLSPRFIKGSVSACPCVACKHCLRREGDNKPCFSTYVCGRVAQDFSEMKTPGHAVVAYNGTCDAAEFVQEKYDNFRLEGERAKLDDWENSDPRRYLVEGVLATQVKELYDV